MMLTGRQVSKLNIPGSDPVPAENKFDEQQSHLPWKWYVACGHYLKVAQVTFVTFKRANHPNLRREKDLES